MTGIFDSGAGGLTALSELRRLCPMEDIVFLADRKNAPYGIRSSENIKRISEENIRRLLSHGADRVLIACCTASTVFCDLPEDIKERCIEIITPAAKAAAEACRERIGVISTEATYKSMAFPRAISAYRSDISVTAHHSAELVELVEGGCRDGNASFEDISFIRSCLGEILCAAPEVLILGCTHFTHIKNIIEEITGIPTVSPSLIGAELAARQITRCESGETTFI